MPNLFVLKKISEGSPLAYIFLAFIAMAGLSYVNFLPGVVNALAGGIGFSDVEAGQIVASNTYGGLLGSVIAIFLVRRVNWQRALFVFFIGLILFDVTTMWINSYAGMLGWRFSAGIFGGLCVGVAFSVLARLSNPDRAFGALLFIQFCIGSLVIYLLPVFETTYSEHAVFLVMAGFSLLSVIFLIFLPRLQHKPKAALPGTSFSTMFAYALLLLLSIAFYQVGASAIWAYVGLIGLGAGIADESVSVYIALTGLLGLLGAALPVISGNRFGRLHWVVAGVVLSMLSAALLRFSTQASVYVVAMALLFFSWPAVLSFLLAVTSELDSSGRLSTIANVVSFIGLASGPLLGASLLDNGNFSMMLNACVITFLLSLFLLFKPVRVQEQGLGVSLSSQFQY
ncbi:MFS transporter [Teredinibacter sp. KSP-S5-2]|uniref:MFS transporter n=1 Tax=Teredinibacter sp. KSP-S5-2 TaxID=3034506 RepID=UPI00293432BD|nr:MFS transporter [Teredinibacter sp. KSP-S5-2]WNO08610.1 hypothetical protein P5V12_16690 [Teredinibacter sp. KSP-S5-2]